MGECVQVRLLKQGDLSDIVSIHMHAFEGFFLTTLGNSFLKTYYKSVLKTKDSILAGAYIDQKLVGFGVGASLAKGYNKRLVRTSLFPFLWEGVKLLFYKPKAIVQLKNNFRKTGEQKDDGRYAELYSIAVEPDVGIRGIGSANIHFFECEAKSQRANRVSLTTDLYENKNVLAFYKKNGYEVYYEFMAYPNRKMVRLIKKI